MVVHPFVGTNIEVGRDLGMSNLNLTNSGAMMNNQQFGFSFGPVLQIVPRLGTAFDLVGVCTLGHGVLFRRQAGAACVIGFPCMAQAYSWFSFTHYRHRDF
jgi:hypothetical protein